MCATIALFRPTEYFKPIGLEEAIGLLTEYGDKCRVIAGGTDVVVEKDPSIQVLVDVTGLGLDYIKSDAQGIRIGAATTFADIGASSILSGAPYNILAQAAHQMGTPQIRNMATIGGNLCSAVPSADSAPALLALDATLGIFGIRGERSVAITDFFRDVRSNALDKNELLTEIQLPAFSDRTEAVFTKKGRVATGDLAIVNAAVRVTITADNICKDVRIALGAVAPTPLRASAAEAMLKGEKLKNELLEKVAAQASEDTKPISDIRSTAEYRRILVRILVERALKEGVTRLLA